MINRKFKYFFKENWFILVFLLVFIFGIFCNIKAASEVASEAKRCGLLGMSYTEFEACPRIKTEDIPTTSRL